MRQRDWRPGKKADMTCPQWILDGVKAIREQATSRGIITESKYKTDSDISEKIRDT